jgi:hypothetical protein
MSRLILPGIVLSTVIGLSVGGAAAQEAPKFSDEAVKSAIEKARDFLLSRQQDGDHWPPFDDGDDKLKNPDGPTALVTYALLEAGVRAQDARIQKALNYLAGRETDKIYTLAMRCNAWLIANRSTMGKYYKNLDKDSRRLVLSAKKGAYCYWTVDGKGFKDDKPDNSNAQYGLLGVWMGARGGVEVSKEYWENVLKYWISVQMNDGGWRYEQAGNTGEGSTATMTTAGIASLYVCYDNMYQDMFINPGKNNPEDLPAGKCIRRGLDWLDRSFTRSLEDGGLWGYGDLFYYLYGVERVALACGHKYFGPSDWYKLGVLRLLREQDDDGSFKGGRSPEISTAFALLFLSRGRSMVLFNKLEREGDWCNRPRDLARLTQWFTDKFETAFNWQVINLKVPVREWHDAPILYIAGCKEAKFSDEDIDKLRTFVNQGGAILSCNEGNGPFGKSMRDVYKKMFPKYALTEVPPDHDLYNCNYKLAGKPKFLLLTNGIRPLAIHTDDDLSLHWQMGRVALQKWAFEAGFNINKYVTDGEFRSRGVSLWPEDEKIETTQTIKLARLRHDGDFDPEPLAYERFAKLLAKNEKIKLEVQGPMPIAELGKSDAKVAAITGTGPLKLTDEDKAALKKWVEGGGTLIIDAAGGSDKFAESVDQLLAGMFTNLDLRTLEATADLYKKVPGKEIARVKYRKQAEAKVGTKLPRVQAVFLKNRPAIYYSVLDLTAGLVGCPIYGCFGYDPDSAYAIMRNILLLAGK